MREIFASGSVRGVDAHRPVPVGRTDPNEEVVHPISGPAKPDAVVQRRVARNVRLYMRFQVALDP